MTRPWKETLLEGYTPDEQIVAMQLEIDGLLEDLKHENSVYATAFDENLRLTTLVDSTKEDLLKVEQEKRVLINSYTNKIMSLEMELSACKQEVLAQGRQLVNGAAIDDNKQFLKTVYDLLVNEHGQNPTSEFMQRLQVIIS